MQVQVLFAAASSALLWQGRSGRARRGLPRLFSVAPGMQRPVDGIRGERLISCGPLFGRLTKSGRAHLLRHGWWDSTQEKSENPPEEQQERRLAFAWPSKSGPQFGVDDASAAHVRPLPRVWTDAFDDKLTLARAIRGSAIAPACIDPPTTEEEEGAVESDRLYFVKHRLGAQGKSVRVCDKQDLLEWCRRSTNARDFVIQEETVPSLYEGRKFVLRCHILIVLSRSGDDAPPALRALLHRKSVIFQHHATTYEAGSTEKSSQVSQAGKRHPLPVLLDDLNSDHPAAYAYEKIQACCLELVGTVIEKNALSGTISALAPETTCFALLGPDLLMDERGGFKVCEVNSHPALGWGTMSKVPSGVFARLIEETMSVLLMDGDGGETRFDPLFP